MGHGTELRDAVAEALRTEENKEDSDVLFAVVGLNKEGQEVELGVASYSLEELLETQVIYL